MAKQRTEATVSTLMARHGRARRARGKGVLELTTMKGPGQAARISRAVKRRDVITYKGKPTPGQAVPL